MHFILGENMDIHSLINKDLIILNFNAQNKQEAFKLLAEKLIAEKRIASLEGFLEDIHQREMIDTTAIGYKIAIPHAKSSHVIEASLVFARSDEGIDCQAIDGDLSHLFFMIAMPEESINMHLRVLAMISRKLMKEEYREALLEAKTQEEVLALIYKID
jgi:PTS system fructose-specific IIC component